MSVMGPLCIISLGIVSIVLIRFGIAHTCVAKNIGVFSRMKMAFSVFYNRKKISFASQPTATRSLTISINPGDLSQPEPANDSNYREPLMLYLQESATYNTTDNN